MNPDMMFLAERLVLAVEEMAQDVKNISGYMYDLSYSVSSFLNDMKKEKKGTSAAHCVGGQETSVESKHSSVYIMGHEEMSNHDVGSNVEDIKYEIDICGDWPSLEKETDVPRATGALDDESPCTQENTPFDEVGLVTRTTCSAQFGPSCFDHPEHLNSEELKRTCKKQFCHVSSDKKGRREVEDRLEENRKEQVNAESESEQNVVHPNQIEAKNELETSRNTTQRPSSSRTSPELSRVQKVMKGPFLCETCGKQFCRIVYLKRHARVHTGEKPFQCTICDKVLATKSNLGIHMRVHSGEKPYSCFICQKSFSHYTTLQGHMRVHSGEKPYSCSICQKSFTQNWNMLKHMRVHSEERPYNCSVCQKSFAQRFTLEMHMRVHTGEKPFPCTFCDKAFKMKSHLLSHTRVHSGERPYKCLICGKSFSRSHHLQVHSRVHTGEKPYKCIECGKAFTQEIDLTRHLQSHNG